MRDLMASIAWPLLALVVIAGLMVWNSSSRDVSEETAEDLGARRSVASEPKTSASTSEFATIAGRVLTKDDQPVVGRAVRLVGDTRDVRSDEHGYFRFEGLAPGDQVVYLPALNGQVEGDAALRAVEKGASIDDVVLRGAPRYALSGRMVDEQGKPIAGVAIRVRSANYRMLQMSGLSRTITSGDPGGSETTDTDGRFKIAGLIEPKNYLIYMNGCKLGSNYDPSDAIHVITVPDSMRIAFRGQVVDPDGKLIALAEMRVRTVPGTDNVHYSGCKAAQVSTLIEEGKFDVELWTKHRGASIDIANARDESGERLAVRRFQEDVDDVRAESIRIQLSRGRTVRGSVLLPSGLPAEGAKVTAISIFDAPKLSKRRSFFNDGIHDASEPSADGRRLLISRYGTTITDRNGRFALHSLPVTSTHLEVIHEPQHRLFRAPLGSGQAETVVKLERAHVMAGRVLDPSGTPYAGALIRTRSGTQHVRPHTTSRSDGTFQLFVDGPNTRISVSPPGTADTKVRLRWRHRGPIHDAPLLLTVEREHMLDVSVVSDQGVPVLAGQIVLVDRNGVAGKRLDSEVRGLRGYTYRARFGPIKAGSYELGFQCDRNRGRRLWLSNRMHVKVPVPPIRMVLKESWELRGKVEGEDLGGFRVTWHPDEPVDKDVDPRGANAMMPMLTTDGTLLVSNIREPRGEIHIRKRGDPREAIFRVERGQKPISIRLKTLDTLEGKLLINESINESTQVVATATQDETTFTSKVRSDGTFDFQGLPPGKWIIEARTPQGVFGPEVVSSEDDRVELRLAKK